MHNLLSYQILILFIVFELFCTTLQIAGDWWTCKDYSGRSLIGSSPTVDKSVVMSTCKVDLNLLPCTDC